MELSEIDRIEGEITMAEERLFHLKHGDMQDTKNRGERIERLESRLGQLIKQLQREKED